MHQDIHLVILVCGPSQEYNQPIQGGIIYLPYNSLPRQQPYNILQPQSLIPHRMLECFTVDILESLELAFWDLEWTFWELVFWEETWHSANTIEPKESYGQLGQVLPPPLSVSRQTTDKNVNCNSKKCSQGQLFDTVKRSRQFFDPMQSQPWLQCLIDLEFTTSC